MKTNSSDCDANVFCKECELCINTELRMYVKCAGPCGMSYHISCVGLSSEHLRSLSHGFVWLCCECTPAFNDWRSAKPKSSLALPVDAKSMDSEISQLQRQVSSIMDTLDRIMPNDTFHNSASPLHSTPVVAAEVMSGTNMCYESERNENSERPETTDDCFSLLLSNIDVYTTESDIEVMVRRCVGAPVGDPVCVMKLMPKRIHYSLLDYISFKVVLKRRWKDLAMCASTWPFGIKFREFVRRSDNPWKP